MKIPEKQKRLLRRSVALTLTCGVLLAGSAGMAYASATTTSADDWAGPTVTIGADKDWEVASMFLEKPAGQNIAAKSIVLNGGKLTLKDGGRLIGLTQDLDFSMTGGSLALTSGSTLNQITSIDAAKVNISGGAIELTGNTGNAWENAAYIGGYDGLTVSSGTINMNANSDLFVGKYTEAGKSTEMRLSGGTINLLGSATAGGYGNDAAHIWASSSGYPSTVTLQMDGAKLVVGNGSDEKYGIISADNATLSAGSITVKEKGHLLLQPNAGMKADAENSITSNVVYGGDLSGTLQIKDKGEFTVAQGGHVDIGQHFKIEQTGGKVTVDGTLFPMGWDNISTGEYVISGGELLVGATSGEKYAPLDGSLHAGVLTINGGKITVGNDETKLPWAKSTALGGYGDITTVTGGTITLNNSGALWAGAQGTSWDTASASALNISGGTITMNGADADSASVIAATSKGAWDSENTKTDHVVLNISDKAAIQVANGKHGYIASRETNMSGGEISVGEGANLTVAGILVQNGKDDGGQDKYYTAKEGLEKANSENLQGGEFTLTGGAIHVGKNGKLDFASGGVDFTMEGGSFTADATSVVNFGDLTYDGGTWGLGKTLTLQDTAGAAAGVYAKIFTVTGEGLALDKITQSATSSLEVDGGSLQLGMLTQGGGSVWVDSKGTLTVGKLEQTGGMITVGGDDGAGTLQVTESLKNQAYASGSAGIAVDNLGTLEADKKILLKDNATLADNVNKLGVLAGSTVKLTGMGEDAITKDDLTKIKKALSGGNDADFKGVLDLGNANIQVDKNEDGTVDYIAGVTNDNLKENTVKVDTTTAGSGVSGGFKDVVVDGMATSVTASNTLQLAGSSTGGDLLKDKNGKQLDLTVGDGAVVTLGDKGAANKGAVGDVAMGSSSADATLNAVGDGAASFTAGAITKGTSGAANIVVEGATLNAESVGAAGAAIDTINLNQNAALKADGDIYVGTVGGNGGALSGENITIATTANITNGAIEATKGDVTLTGGASGVSGSIAASGDINAAGQDIHIAADEGAALALRASEIKAKDISATSVTAKTLTATGDVALSGAGSTLSLAEDSTVSGALNLTGTNATIAKNLDVSKLATIDGGTLTAENGALNLTKGAALKGGALVNVKDLTIGSNEKLIVGSDAPGEGGATLIADTLKLNGGDLIVDPAWEDAQGNKIPASVAAIKAMNADPTKADIVADGNIGVGQNAMLTFGTNDTAWLLGQIDQMTNGAGLTKDGITAALGLKEHMDVNGKALIVNGGVMNGDLTTEVSGGGIHFADNSLLVIDNAAFDATTPANGAIHNGSGTVSATVDAGAALRITGAKIDTDYKVFGAGITATINGWKADGELSTDSKLIDLKSNNDGTFTTSQVFAKDIYKNLTPSLQGTLDTMIGKNLKDTESEQGGVKFLSRATADGAYLNNDVLAQTTIEGAARMAALGGVPQMTLTAIDASRNAIDARTSFASADQGRLTLLNDNSEESGGALWMMPIYQKVKTDDLNAGHYGYDVDGHLTGAAFGYDYTNNGNTRTGLTFSFGSGSADSTGLSYTDNDLDYWGIGAYTSWKHDNFNFVADLSYAKTKNDLTQSLSSAMDMGQLKADDISGKALSFGLRGEYRYQNGDAEVIPHFGIRYTKLDTDGYNAYATKGGNVLSASDSSQKIWTFPIGVTFTKTIEQKSGWKCKPVFDFSLIPASGDLDADSVVRFNGVDHSALVSTEVMGDFSYKGTLGVEFGKDNLTYGIGYSIQASSEMTNHTVYGMVRYAF